jgi:alpha-1,3-rhamnosyltransferase
VSVIVITYNSQDFIIETLESVKSQNIDNLELIISDDCSSDSTIELCKYWLEVNKKVFLKSNIILSDKNTGIPANCNRGIYASNGDWIKLLAGDDQLMPGALSIFLNFVKNNNNCRIVHAREVRLIHTNDKNKIVRSNKAVATITEQMTTQAQFKVLKFSTILNAPTVFIKKQLLEKLNYFDENIRLCEDWPFWLKVSLSGEKIYFLNAEVVLYRIHSKSIYSSNDGKYLINPFLPTEIQIYLKYIRPNLNFLERLFFDYSYNLKKIFLKYNSCNSYIKINKFLYKSLNLPFDLYFKFTLKINLYKYLG